MRVDEAEQFAAVLMKQYGKGQTFDVALPREDLHELVKVFEAKHNCKVVWYEGRDRIAVTCPE